MAGWGSTQDSMCTTDANGPDPFTRCKFPFLYAMTTFHNCVPADSPTYANPLCKALLKAVGKVPATGYTSTSIFDEKGKLLTECFGSNVNRHGGYGWCATCRVGAKPGQPGYCGNESKDEEAEKPTVPYDKFWGYCGKQCETRETLKSLLQEAKLEILPAKECAKMGASMKVMLNIELCAAKQVFKIFKN